MKKKLPFKREVFNDKTHYARVQMVVTYHPCKRECELVNTRRSFPKICRVTVMIHSRLFSFPYCLCYLLFMRFRGTWLIFMRSFQAFVTHNSYQSNMSLSNPYVYHTSTLSLPRSCGNLLAFESDIQVPWNLVHVSIYGCFVE